MNEVRAMGARTTNAELMADVARLGWIRPGDRVLDATYGEGRFWRTYTPPNLTCSDIEPKAPHVEPWDFTALPVASRSYDVVVFDPPYKLNGTSTNRGPATSDIGYGVGGPGVRWQDRHTLIRAGITECARVASRVLMVKCMDQVVSGAKRWQTREFADHAEAQGFRLADQLHVGGYRAQPAGRLQVHARGDYSTLLVLERT